MPTTLVFCCIDLVGLGRRVCNVSRPRRASFPNLIMHLNSAAVRCLLEQDLASTYVQPVKAAGKTLPSESIISANSRPAYQLPLGIHNREVFKQFIFNRTDSCKRHYSGVLSKPRRHWSTAEAKTRHDELKHCRLLGCRSCRIFRTTRSSLIRYNTDWY